MADPAASKLPGFCYVAIGARQPARARNECAKFRAGPRNRPSACRIRVYPTATSTSDAKTAVLGLTLELNDAPVGRSTTKSDRGGSQ
jgi:hypothetical protein